MRIAVIGAGGIGAIYGASLAKAGAEVVFVARGAHLAAMRENGLRIEGDRGETHIRPARATDDMAGIGAVDYVLLAVKLWDVESAGAQIRPIVGPETAVIPLQNGVDAAERLTAILGAEPVMGGTAFVTGSIVSPGVVRQTGTYQQMTFGELDGPTSARGERLRDLCAAAGFDGVLSPDVRVPIWQKFILVVALANLNALTRLPLGKWRAEPDLVALYEDTVGETIAVALVIGSSPEITSHLFATGYSLPSVIANQFGESSGTFRAALLGMGVLLFAFTIIINVLARGIVERNARKKRGA